MIKHKNYARYYKKEICKWDIFSRYPRSFWFRLRYDIICRIYYRIYYASPFWHLSNLPNLNKYFTVPNLGEYRLRRCMSIFELVVKCFTIH